SRLFSTPPPPPNSPLFPYTTLFRSFHLPPGSPHPPLRGTEDQRRNPMIVVMNPQASKDQIKHVAGLIREMGLKDHIIQGTDLTRSEEHTSELQSQSNLVCRLLLEKK